MRGKRDPGTPGGKTGVWGRSPHLEKKTQQLWCVANAIHSLECGGSAAVGRDGVGRVRHKISRLSEYTTPKLIHHPSNITPPNKDVWVVYWWWCVTVRDGGRGPHRGRKDSMLERQPWSTISKTARTNCLKLAQKFPEVTFVDPKFQPQASHYTPSGGLGCLTGYVRTETFF